ncbi:hypothetical protein COPG_00123 [Colwellia phage 9A]|uniref:Uncharacterized protein n=1 Tax=Colwellia phage 9A TaxID=765765 RepID=I3UMK4_9CAUD|nr:hypothetical protein COPG_00123 [Colwellia phage 9A]AFK66719.1 hypothetical protein COPG_00123 [Colwellia phage 9A]
MLNFKKLSPKIQHAINNDSLTHAVWNKHLQLGVHTINKKFLQELAEHLLDVKVDLQDQLVKALCKRPVVMKIGIEPAFDYDKSVITDVCINDKIHKIE